MPDEQWKDVVGYEGLYQVSDMGRIKSLLRNIILKPWRNKNGNKYRLVVALWKNKSKNIFYVHQLVLQAFTGPCPDEMECCHNDGNSANNYLGNLRYGTHTSNMGDMILHGNSQKGTKNFNCRLTEQQVLEIINLLKREYTLQEIADRFNVSISFISNIKNKKSWKHLTTDIELSRRHVRKMPNKGSTKLTNDDIDTIRELIDRGLRSKEIAEKFGVSFETINRIRKGVTFRRIS